MATLSRSASTTVTTTPDSSSHGGASDPPKHGAPRRGTKRRLDFGLLSNDIEPTTPDNDPIPFRISDIRPEMSRIKNSHKPKEPIPTLPTTTTTTTTGSSASSSGSQHRSTTTMRNLEDTPTFTMGPITKNVGRGGLPETGSVKIFSYPQENEQEEDNQEDFETNNNNNNKTASKSNTISNSYHGTSSSSSSSSVITPGPNLDKLCKALDLDNNGIDMDGLKSALGNISDMSFRSEGKIPQQQQQQQHDYKSIIPTTTTSTTGSEKEIKVEIETDMSTASPASRESQKRKRGGVVTGPGPSSLLNPSLQSIIKPSSSSSYSSPSLSDVLIMPPIGLLSKLSTSSSLSSSSSCSPVGYNPKQEDEDPNGGISGDGGDVGLRFGKGKGKDVEMGLMMGDGDLKKVDSFDVVEGGCDVDGKVGQKVECVGDGGLVESGTSVFEEFDEDVQDELEDCDEEEEEEVDEEYDEDDEDEEGDEADDEDEDDDEDTKEEEQLALYKRKPLEMIVEVDDECYQMVEEIMKEFGNGATTTTSMGAYEKSWDFGGGRSSEFNQFSFYGSYSDRWELPVSFDISVDRVLDMQLDHLLRKKRRETMDSVIASRSVLPTTPAADQCKRSLRRCSSRMSLAGLAEDLE
ncbi:hypothetical protein HDU76_013078 [Blyttiomyces sp. JEL0837]|nr:hypothetical protein HDU76_013078 [Blyttiomyces sp. JEL0837]